MYVLCFPAEREGEREGGREGGRERTNYVNYLLSQSCVQSYYISISLSGPFWSEPTRNYQMTFSEKYFWYKFFQNFYAWREKSNVRRSEGFLTLQWGSKFREKI